MTQQRTQIQILSMQTVAVPTVTPGAVTTPAYSPFNTQGVVPNVYPVPTPILSHVATIKDDGHRGVVVSQMNTPQYTQNSQNFVIKPDAQFKLNQQNMISLLNSLNATTPSTVSNTSYTGLLLDVQNATNPDELEETKKKMINMWTTNNLSSMVNEVVSKLAQHIPGAQLNAILTGSANSIYTYLSDTCFTHLMNMNISSMGLPLFTAVMEIATKSTFSWILSHFLMQKPVIDFANFMSIFPQ